MKALNVEDIQIGGGPPGEINVFGWTELKAEESKQEEPEPEVSDEDSIPDVFKKEIKENNDSETNLMV